MMTILSTVEVGEGDDNIIGGGIGGGEMGRYVTSDVNIIVSGGGEGDDNIIGGGEILVMTILSAMEVRRY